MYVYQSSGYYYYKVYKNGKCKRVSLKEYNKLSKKYTQRGGNDDSITCTIDNNMTTCGGRLCFYSDKYPPQGYEDFDQIYKCEPNKGSYKCLKHNNNNINPKRCYFTFMSFNVQFYETMTKTQEDMKKDVADFIVKYKPDIVALQEDIYGGNTSLKNGGYELISQCRAERLYDFNLSNSIYVRKEIKNYVSSNNPLVTKNESPERCASVINILGKVIVNTHLTGGRYDDNEYVKFDKQREKELKEIVDKYDPDLILGDFNSENTEDKAKQQLEKYSLYKMLNDSNKTRFLTYYMSGHKYLTSNNYQIAYDPPTKTSKFGGKPDHIYKKSNSSVKVFQARILEEVLMDKLSDHNPLFFKFSLA